MDPSSGALWALFSGHDLVQGDMPDGGAGDRREAAEASREARRAARAASDLERELGQKVDTLALICRAMWELLRETGGLSEQALLDKIAEVDLLDGAADGRVRTPPQKCPECGRTVSKKRQRCIYCGARALTDTAFEML